MNSQAMKVAKKPGDNGGRINILIQALIMGLLVVVSLGYVLIWILFPTTIYRGTWLPKIRAQTVSTYFGTHGSILLLYTFPPLFVAVFGCLYLHLAKNNSGIKHGNVKTRNRLAVWRRPLILKWLGIVSSIELAFFVMFIALLVWSFATYLNNGFSTITLASAAKHGEKVWESKLESAGLMLGVVGNICLAFLFFPVTRGSSVLQFFGLTSEASIKYHIWLGHITMIIFTAHSICYIIYWAVTHQIAELVKWQKTGVSNLPGDISLVAGLVMWATTFPSIRRKTFELFFYIHYLYILFVFFFILHVGISYSFITLPGLYLFLVDRYLRFLQSRQNVRLMSARILPCETVELNFSKTKVQTYTPTSILFVNLPGISRLQWHPFTITSSSSLEPERLSVIIKGEGSWTKKLYQMLSSPSSIDHIDASIEGPYGPSSLDFLRHDLLVMVSGGSGIAPFISIIRELMYVKETTKCKTPNKILLIAAFKYSLDLTMLDLILPMPGSTVEIPKIDLQIEAYVTREERPNVGEINKNIITKWFKPKISASPIAPILGPNNWLWLGAIISSSFIIFLFLYGILMRFYIFPIDQNTNRIYSFSSKAVLSILFMCISIIIASTAAFLWNKKHNAMDSKQIQNLDAPTPQASPSTNSSYYVDKELESLPQQSIVLSTNVHYNERPDLKRILFEQKESSVGVVVCGPKKMRHEVAKICSSGLATNLHFENMSFSW